MTGDDLGSRMSLELSALAGDRLPAIRRAAAAQIVAGLLAELDRPPPPASRLHRERQLRAGPGKSVTVCDHRWARMARAPQVGVREADGRTQSAV
jgi:hypothetical protein